MSDGKIHQSAGAFASRENAKKAIKKYYQLAKTYKIEAWKIVDLRTGSVVEQSGRM
jgi:hypothetical protein